MYPRLEIGSLSVDNYTLLLGLGIAIGIVCVLRLAKQAGLSLRPFPFLIVGGLIAGLFGCHWLDVCVQWSDYRIDPWRILAFWESRAFIGGPVVALVFVVCHTRWRGMPAWTVLDCLVPGLAIGQVFGRMGCCAAGCCHGCPTQSCLGVCFTTSSVHPAQWRGLPLHPTQLYEAAGTLALFYGLLWLWRRRSFDGQVVLAYCFAYPILRFCLEFYRGDAIRGFVIGWLSTSQLVSLLIFSGGLIALFCRLRQIRSTRASPALDHALSAACSIPVQYLRSMHALDK
jgi:phosphatidylglycerol:prolipoprotein diacylglycerol transferase